ncbi:hypothetical protein SAMN05216481_11719 [Streptomyces radiopugnans]|uniref:Uncharacterized protein n=1 Tax=Streptomyces radiopugnans TaxID=403935 RepID=A0A1H9JBF4_9ACTN|nr:hypothetical protein SAMN05216481_11719 [Streptomyces radiopugnans]
MAGPSGRRRVVGDVHDGGAFGGRVLEHFGDPPLRSIPAATSSAAPGRGRRRAILVDLQRVPVHIDQIVFAVNSFTGQTFA